MLQFLDIRNGIFSRQLGKKSYELKDHLGNVRTTFSDIKMPTGTPSQPFEVDLLSKFEYYPGGMPIFDLTYQTEVTRYGYNSGAEVDREIFSQKDRAFSTLFREGDTYTLRWWSQDPKRRSLPHQSSYSYMDANPISKNDPDGDITPLAGAAIGASFEFGFQFVDGLMQDKSVWQSIKDVDYNDVFIAAGTGALTSGGSAISTLGTRMVKAGLLNVLEESVKAHTGSEKHEYTSLKALQDFGIGAGGEGLAKFIAIKAKTSDKGKELFDDATSKNNIVLGKKNPRNAQIERADKAFNKAMEYGEGKVAKSTVKASENIIDKAFGKIYDIYFKENKGNKGNKNETNKPKK